jgi:hypothetical protein
VRWLNDLAWARARSGPTWLGTTTWPGSTRTAAEVTDIVNARAAAERHRRPAGDHERHRRAAQPGEFLLTGKGWRSIRHVRLKPEDRDRGQQRLLAGRGELLDRI